MKMRTIASSFVLAGTLIAAIEVSCRVFEAPLRGFDWTTTLGWTGVLVYLLAVSSRDPKWRTVTINVIIVAFALNAAISALFGVVIGLVNLFRFAQHFMFSRVQMNAVSADISAGLTVFLVFVFSCRLAVLIIENLKKVKRKTRS
jgi:hypothetical protein